eukprot:TRINITY_DN6831_c0_g1_i2.p1 TRINITY_DN6831_c0_g1~~TRINITY_DN6831_c0_g1_i2.p1  ORF type:complete len:421 (-),score=77.06 TRINITY_DN6831_c0_g1_i2:89-1351(-)
MCIRDRYRKEFENSLETFKKLLPDLRGNPGKDSPTLCSFLLFFSQIYHQFPQDLAFYSAELVNLLEQYHSILHVNTRSTCVQCLVILRTKNMISPVIVVPLFTKLFKCEDKKLRETLFGTIVNDIKRINLKKKNVHINTQLQNFFYSQIERGVDRAAKASLLIMIELYRKHVWTDEKTVNGISAGCLSKNPKMVVAACRFMMDVDLTAQDLDEEEEEDKEEKKSEIMRQLGSKLPKKKKGELRKILKLMDRKQKRKSKNIFQTQFFPIDLIYDPQGFTEKLFAKLPKTKAKKKELKTEARVTVLNLVAKMIGRHKLDIPEFFSYANQLLKQQQKDLPRLLASIAEACHEDLQREDVKDMIGTITDQLVSENCIPEMITMGLNTIREISLRMPHVLCVDTCLLYTSPSPRDLSTSRMPSSA